MFFDIWFESLIRGWTNANGFLVDFGEDILSFVVDTIFECDIDENKYFKLISGFIGWDASDI